MHPAALQPKPRSFLFAATLLVASASSSQAALLWWADLSTYTNGQTIVTNNSSGANDTFSRITNGTLTARDPSAPFSTGLFADMDSTGTSNIVSRRNLGAYGDGDVRVVSFDLARTSAGSLNLRVDFIDSAYTSLGSGLFSSLAIPAADTLYRMTAVYNQSGSSITLPGTLGSLGDGFGALYYKTTSGSYTLIGSFLSLGTNTGAGFQLAWTGSAAGRSSMFDNLGYWSSASDMVGGVNVLALDPGMALVPEPSSVAYLFGGLAVGLISWRRRRSAAGVI